MTQLKNAESDRKCIENNHLKRFLQSVLYLTLIQKLHVQSRKDKELIPAIFISSNSFETRSIIEIKFQNDIHKMIIENVRGMFVRKRMIHARRRIFPISSTVKRKIQRQIIFKYVLSAGENIEDSTSFQNYTEFSSSQKFFIEFSRSDTRIRIDRLSKTD